MRTSAWAVSHLLLPKDIDDAAAVAFELDIPV